MHLQKHNDTQKSAWKKNWKDVPVLFKFLYEIINKIKNEIAM